MAWWDRGSLVDLGTLNVLIGLLRWYRLVANFAKSRAMTCHLGAIWSRISEEVVL